MRINGKPIENYDELRLTISQLAPGSKVALYLARWQADDGQRHAGAVCGKPNEVLDGVEVGKADG